MQGVLACSPTSLVCYTGFLYPFRHPKSKGAVEGLLYGLGSMLRGVGVALDDIGAMVQGPPGACPEHGARYKVIVGTIYLACQGISARQIQRKKHD